MRPYAKDLVSWPAAGTSPVALTEGFAGADRQWLEHWRAHMLRPPEEVPAVLEELGVARCYVDP
eukprot:7658324-Lingulodinium_polyedra.AAC.1